MRERLSLYLDLIRWNRPAGWLLLLWPSLSALWIAARGFPGWHLIIVFVLGTILMRSAGCCINDVADKEFDKHVKRTANRPVTAGKVSVIEAYSLAAGLALCAFGLVLSTNTLTVQYSFLGLVLMLVYPYAKRVVAMPQAVLGLAFSFGIPMAFAAVQAQVPWQAWALYIGNIFWVLAYDTEYAMVDRDDDIRIGMKTSAITLGQHEVLSVMLFYALYLGSWTAIAYLERVQLGFYLFATLAGVQALWHYQLIKNRERLNCFRAFTLNHWLGCSMFLAWVVAYPL